VLIYNINKWMSLVHLGLNWVIHFWIKKKIDKKKINVVMIFPYYYESLDVFV